MRSRFSRQLPTQPRRDAWVEINLGALERNCLKLRKAIPQNQELMAIVKADAYGHGAVMVIPVLEASGVSRVGVASMDEAMQIREAGLDIPILVLGGVPDWAFPLAAERDISLTVFTERHLENLHAAYQLTGKPVRIHVKVDTGMHRVGAPWKQAATYIQKCSNLEPVAVLEGLFSHLACGNQTEENILQWERWQSVLEQLDHLPDLVHIANSEGSFHLPQAHQQCNMVRMGIAFFGYGPELPEPLGASDGLKGTHCSLAGH